MIARHMDVIGVTRCTITIVTGEGTGAPWAEIVAHTQLLSSLDIDTKRRNKIAACPSACSPETIFNSISRTMIDSDKKPGLKKINKNMLSIGLGQYHVD